ncbi:hypothetical protein FQR65_LT16342 [Abscondita terminalis]|nr:hypothetical protein FQR65_LT16342 [Abscondita terminalis]
MMKSLVYISDYAILPELQQNMKDYQEWRIKAWLAQQCWGLSHRIAFCMKANGSYPRLFDVPELVTLRIEPSPKENPKTKQEMKKKQKSNDSNRVCDASEVPTISRQDGGMDRNRHMMAVIMNFEEWE